MEQKSNNPILIIGVVVVLVLGVLLGMNMKKTSVDTTDQTGAAARTSVVTDANRLATTTSTPTLQQMIASRQVKLLNLSESQNLLSKINLTFGTPTDVTPNRLMVFACPPFVGFVVIDTNGTDPLSQLHNMYNWGCAYLGSVN